MRVMLILLLLLIPKIAFSQCVAEIKDVKIDEQRGSIIVETEYKLNNVVVQLGRTRYLETSGTNAEIIAKAKEDVLIHCKNLITRIENNGEYLKEKMVEQQKSLTTPIIKDIKDYLIGDKTTVNEVIQSYKGIDIKVTYDEKNTTTDEKNTTTITPAIIE